MNVGRGHGHLMVVAQHLEDAILHAYAREELDAAQAAAVEAHLGACGRCGQALRRVSATLSLLDAAQPPAWDDLKWQRMLRRVKADAVAEAQTRLRPRPIRTAQWAAAAAIVLAVGATLWRLEAEQERVAPALRSRPGPALSASSETLEKSYVQAHEAMSLELASGASVELAPESRLWLPVQPALDLIELEHGAMAIRLESRPESPLRVKTPGFTVWAHSEDFMVSYWGAERGEVHARAGVLEVVPETGPPSVVEAPEHQEVVPAKPQTRLRRARAVAKGGETTVHVLSAPKADPVAEALDAANEAFYISRDLPKTIAQAQKVIEQGGARVEGKEARILLCHAYVALEQGSEAAKACQDALGAAGDPEARQEIHQMLGNIYRSELGQCESAIEHYGKAMVFGRRSLLDTAARLGRLRCFLELGEWDQATADLLFLEQAGDVPVEEILELKRDLELRRGSGR